MQENRVSLCYDFTVAVTKSTYFLLVRNAQTFTAFGYFFAQLSIKSFYIQSASNGIKTGNKQHFITLPDKNVNVLTVRNSRDFNAIKVVETRSVHRMRQCINIVNEIWHHQSIFNFKLFACR